MLVVRAESRVQGTSIGYEVPVPHAIPGYSRSSLARHASGVSAARTPGPPDLRTPVSLDSLSRRCHRACGAGPRPTSRDSAPAGIECEAKGGTLPDPYRRSFAFTTGTAGEWPVVYPRET